MPLYDLSRPIESGMPVYPGSDPVRVEPASTIEDEARVTALTLDTHAGTHVDAPSHILPDGAPIDELDVSQFVFDALRVDLTEISARASIEVTDLPSPTDHEMLVLQTGFEDEWGTDRYRDHPYLSEKAAEWCAEHGYSLGLDTFGPDPTPSANPDRECGDEPDGYPAHERVLSSGCVIVENLTGLAALPREFRLFAFPLSLPGVEASPVRAVAETE